MKFLNVLAFIILFVGGINWALIGIFNFNLVAEIFMGFRSVGSIIVYVLVGASALWLVLSAFMSHGHIRFKDHRSE